MFDQVYRPFTGTLKKLVLVSDGVGYGPVPNESDEVQQRLTINSARDAWLTRYAFGDGEKYRRIKREKLKLDADHLEDLFRAVTAVFGSDTEDRFATDVGTWELELTNTDEETFQYVGSMCGDVLYGGRELSDILRDALDAPDLLAFGGGKDEDTVIRIELDYQLGARHELLIADYDDGEILYVIEDDDLHRSMEKRIHDPEEVRQALMGLDTSLFRDPVPAQDAEEPVSERPIYRLQVKTYGGKSLVSEGGSILELISQRRGRSFWIGSWIGDKRAFGAWAYLTPTCFNSLNQNTNNRTSRPAKRACAGS